MKDELATLQPKSKRPDTPLGIPARNQAVQWEKLMGISHPVYNKGILNDVQLGMVRRLFLMFWLFASGNFVQGQLMTGGGLRIFKVVDTAQRVLPIARHGVCVQAFELDSATLQPIRPVSLQNDAAGLPISPTGQSSVMYLAPLMKKEQIRGTRFCQRLVLAYNGDTMVVDFMDIPGADDSRRTDELQRLEFRPGHLIVRWDPGKARPADWHRYSSDKQVRIRGMMRRGIYRDTWAALEDEQMLTFTPASALGRWLAKPAPYKGTASVQYLGGVADGFLLKLDGWLMTDGNCQPSPFWGLQRYAGEWVDIIGKMNFSQLDCGPSSVLYANMPLLISFSEMAELQENVGDARALKPGRYRVLVLDNELGAHFSEAFDYVGIADLPPGDLDSFQVLTQPMITVSPTTIHIRSPHPGIQVGELAVYRFLEYVPPVWRDTDDLILEADFAEALPYLDMVINGQPLTGCLVIASETNHRSASGEVLHFLNLRYYHGGRLVRRVIKGGYNIHTGQLVKLPQD